MRIFNKIYNEINNAGGFWSFIAIILFVIVEFSNFFNEFIWNPSIDLFYNILRILKYPLEIPVWLFLLFILIFIIIIIKYGDWGLIFKTFYKNDIVINSDETSIFVSSVTYHELENNKNCHAFRGNHYWDNEAADYEQLKGSFWISDRVLITNKEAEDGGVYLIKKEFENPFNSHQIKFAQLYIVVDDECTVFINGKIVQHFVFYNNLHELEVKEHLIRGVNSITFEIKNWESVEMRTPGTVNYNSHEKGKFNPYGVRYKLTIKKI